MAEQPSIEVGEVSTVGNLQAPPEGPYGGGDASRGMRVMARQLLRRPGLWPIAVSQAFRLAGPDWWRKWPPVPVPTSELWRLRMQTAYGNDGSATPREEDVVSYLEWCRTARKWRSG